MKKIIMIMTIAFVLNGCGTIMTRKEKLITINTNTNNKVKLYLNNQYMGDRKQVYVKNRGWSKDHVMVENASTGEKRIVPLNYSFNGWAIPSVFFGFIGLGVDLVAGSYTTLDNDYYYVNFSDTK